MWVWKICLYVMFAASVFMSVYYVLLNNITILLHSNVYFCEKKGVGLPVILSLPGLIV